MRAPNLGSTTAPLSDISGHSPRLGPDAEKQEKYQRPLLNEGLHLLGFARR